MGVWNNVPSPNSGGILFEVKIEYTHATANPALYQQQFARLHKADQRIAEPELPFSSHCKNIFSSCVTFENARFADISILSASFLILLLLHCKSMLLFGIGLELCWQITVSCFEMHRNFGPIHHFSSLKFQLGDEMCQILFFLYYFSYRDVFGI